MFFAGFEWVHRFSMQKRKNVRSRSSFFRAEIGASFQVSRYRRTSSTDKEATDRPTKCFLSSSVSNRYFPTEALERFLASQSRMKASHAFGTVLCSVLFPDSHSRTNF